MQEVAALRASAEDMTAELGKVLCRNLMSGASFVLSRAWTGREELESLKAEVQQLTEQITLIKQHTDKTASPPRHADRSKSLPASPRKRQYQQPYGYKMASDAAAEVISDAAAAEDSHVCPEFKVELD
eukprot:scaffold253038_cov37-Prasinocladus_malaysianus.AAC.1